MGSIRALGRPIACGNTRSYRPIGEADTGSLSPYFAIAQYGLFVALFRYRSIRALCRPISLSLNTRSYRPISPYGLNTGSGSGYVLVSLRAYAYAFLPGVALRYTPGCILAPLQGALDPNRALRAPAKYVGTFPGR